MLSIGYLRSAYDACVYYQKLADGSFIYLLLYVDDMLVASRDIAEINKLKVQLSSEFEMKDLGAAKKILRMEIHRIAKEGSYTSLRANIFRKFLNVLVWRRLSLWLRHLQHISSCQQSYLHKQRKRCNTCLMFHTPVLLEV